jgi:hypothetical protein
MKTLPLLLLAALLPACKTAEPQLDLNGQPLRKAPLTWFLPGFTFGLSYQGINAGITFPGRPAPTPDLPVTTPQAYFEQQKALDLPEN